MAAADGLRRVVMGKFIELHRIPLGGCDAFPILVNLDDVSVFFPVSGTTLVFC